MDQWIDGCLDGGVDGAPWRPLGVGLQNHFLREKEKKKTGKETNKRRESIIKNESCLISSPLMSQDSCFFLQMKRHFYFYVLASFLVATCVPIVSQSLATCHAGPGPKNKFWAFVLMRQCVTGPRPRYSSCQVHQHNYQWH